MAAKKKAKPNAKKSVKRKPAAKKKTRKTRVVKTEMNIPHREKSLLEGYVGQEVIWSGEAPFEVVKVFANEHAVFCIANDQRVYKWDTRGAVWKLFKDGI